MTGGLVTDLHGSRPEAVVAAIKERHARHLLGDRSPDGRKIALVIEGGALRAVSSAGGAVVLAQLGYSDTFDEVYATSAAVMNASYFISNQPLLGISVYFDNCTKRDFIDPWRPWKVVDVDYIFDYVAAREKPLDVQKVLNSCTTLFVAVIDKRTGEGLMVNTKTARSPLLSVLKASAALPVFYNRAVEVDGRACMDGGLVIPFGLRHALANGCSHVLVLSTRPADYVDREPSWFSRLVFNMICARGNSALNRVFAQKHLRSRESRALAVGNERAVGEVCIATICAEESENIPRLTTNRAVLRTAAISYGRKLLRVFGGDPQSWTLPEDCGADADAQWLRTAAVRAAGLLPKASDETSE